MEIINKGKMTVRDLINDKAASLSQCRDSGHCKYCIRGKDYSN